ncbi:HpcH/HpaI aldolase/citrate lyase family protein [Halorussus salinisoli]|uniref:HpcH/HpaI aldolase/citrate lyase family protein n=1 Tax=Halorussus salinisoli TaxID=2558242 RepID=UPI0010C200B8|nr:CoA ester lyase [Halorussus salinisoli]
MAHRRRRSALFTPADDVAMMQKAATTAADGLVFDLEDAVPEDAKGDARANLERVVNETDFGNKEVATRINGVRSDHWKTDIESAVEAKVDAVCVPMVEHMTEVHRVHDELAALSDDPPVVRLGVESPEGVFGGADIARAGDETGAVSLSYGIADYCRAIGAPSITDRVRSQLEFLVSSYAALGGLEAFASVYLDLEDEQGLRRAAESAREVGFGGMAAIHPKQLSVINEAFTPSEDEVERARRLVTAFDDAEKDSLLVEGVFLDTATAERYRELVEQYERASE